jgi:hypothetical protein
MRPKPPVTVVPGEVTVAVTTFEGLPAPTAVFAITRTW